MSQREPSQNPPMLWYHSLVQKLGTSAVYTYHRLIDIGWEKPFQNSLLGFILTYI